MRAGNRSTSKKSGLRRSLSRSALRVLIVVASSVASTWSVERSFGSNLAVPTGPSNSPLTFDTTMCRTENCAAECPGSIVQATGCPSAGLASARPSQSNSAGPGVDRFVMNVTSLLVEQFACPAARRNSACRNPPEGAVRRTARCDGGRCRVTAGVEALRITCDACRASYRQRGRSHPGGSNWAGNAAPLRRIQALVTTIGPCTTSPAGVSLGMSTSPSSLSPMARTVIVSP